MTNHQTNDGLSCKKVTVKVTVEDEAVYEISRVVLDSELAEFKEDLIDHYINDLIMRLRQKRKITVYGTCSDEKCSLPRTSNPLIAGSTKCAPHDRQEFIISSESSRHA
jgi:hypothetical protein